MTSPPDPASSRLPPVVTVGIPTFNRRELLAGALESVLSQGFRDSLVVVSDNGSRDGTEELVREVSARDPRVRYHRFAENRGPAENWRYLLGAAETELVALLPDDDLWLPGHLDAAVAALRAHPAASLYVCRAEYFGDRSGTLVGPRWVGPDTGVTVFDSHRNAIPWLFGNQVAAAAVVFRQSAFRGIEVYADDTFGCGDWLTWGRLALRGPMVCDTAVRVRYRWHESNDSNTALKGRRWAAQARFVIRTLASEALGCGALDLPAMMEEVADTWPEPEAATVVVALASIDTPAPLRRAAAEIFRRRAVRAPWSGSRHCRIAARVGLPYLACADMVDRVIGRWWRPRRRR
jgi:GT2 family glycosyltransferase